MLKLSAADEACIDRIILSDSTGLVNTLLAKSNIYLSRLPEQFPDAHVLTVKHKNAYSNTRELQNTVSAPEDLTPHQKIAAGNALRAEGRSELSTGVYLTSAELQQVITVYLDSLLTQHPMKPIDAVAAVHPESAYMLVKRANDTQGSLIRAAVRGSLGHPVLMDCVAAYGQAVLIGCVADSIGASMNALRRHYLMVRDITTLQAQVALLTKQVAELQGAGTRTDSRSLDTDTVVQIHELLASGMSQRKVAAQVGVSVGAVAKYASVRKAGLH